MDKSGKTIPLPQFIEAVGRGSGHPLNQEQHACVSLDTQFPLLIVAGPGSGSFAGARIQPPKPKIRPERKSVGVPVMGMFREDAQTLAHDLSEFLRQVFSGGGVSRVLDDGS